METEFSALASRIATGVSGVRACVIMSRDGLVLGAHPADGETTVRQAWLRFAALGEVDRGFLQFAGELWAFVSRGPYSAFALTATTTRPGLLLDEMEQALIAAQEARARQDVTRIPEGPSIASKPRTSLHPEPRPASPAAGPTPAPAVAPATAATPAAATPAAPTHAAPAPSAPAAPSEMPKAPELEEAPGPRSEIDEPAIPDVEVDRVALAQEFARLLEESGYDGDEDR